MDAGEAVGLTTDERAEVTRLRRENRTLRVERQTGGSCGTVEGLATDAFDIELGGGAALKAAGSASGVSIQRNGGATAALKQLLAGSVTIDLPGGSRAEVSASDEVVGSVSGGARAVVAGGAILNVSASGGGEVSRA